MSSAAFPDKVRPTRVHFRSTREGSPLCGTLTRRPVVTGDEWQVSCRSCLRTIASRKRRGIVDLFGGAA